MIYYNNTDLKNITYFDDKGFLKVERWMDILGFEGYQISDCGRVKSLSKKINSIYSSTGYRITSTRILKQRKDKDSYLLVNISNTQKKATVKVHRLVAQAFIPNPENKQEVNHKNYKTDYNFYSNLEWNTPKENTSHRLKRYFKNKLTQPCQKKQY